MTRIRKLHLLPLAGALAAALAAPAQAQPAFDTSAATTQINATLDKQYPQLESLYKDIHAHPEVGFQENRTAALLAARMRELGFTVTEKVGKTGIVAVYKNGPGPVVMVRTELDALPMEEKTGRPYASKEKQTVNGGETFVAHACGHDVHMAWWVGTAEALLAMKDKWQGTLVFVGQPAEEIISGAKAMLEDGLFTKFPKPDYGFAAHVTAAPMNTVMVKQGVTTSAADTMYITFHGVGAHGSRPHMSVDPIVIGARFVQDVQTVVSRQLDAQKFGVITVGSFNAGTVANIIPDHADLKLTLRSYDPEVRQLLKNGVTRFAKASADMAGAPAPDIKNPEGTASVINDEALAAQEAAVLKGALKGQEVTLAAPHLPGGSASEDYSEYVAAGMTKSVFFSIGSQTPQTLAKYKAEGKTVPGNHSPYFAPEPGPAIRTGVQTLSLAVLSVAGKGRAATQQ